MTLAEFREAAALMLEKEVVACLRDIRPNDGIGRREAHTRASALATAAADIRAMKIED